MKRSMAVYSRLFSDLLSGIHSLIHLPFKCVSESSEKGTKTEGPERPVARCPPTSSQAGGSRVKSASGEPCTYILFYCTD